MSVEVIHNDWLSAAALFPENHFSALVADPPYGLGFMGKKWDYKVPSVEMWAAGLRVMKPGAHGLIACGTRTQHRMVVNIEDAGFEIRDVITWHYGQGFPKSLNCENGIGTALKPATEFWTLVRKPISEKTIADNIAKWGTGGINIDLSRIGLNGEDPPTGSAKRVFAKNDFNRDNTKYGNNTTTPESGRFPANVIFDDFTANILDEQTGVLKSGAMTKSYEYKNNGFSMGKPTGATKQIHEADSGGASRFFYCAKPSKAERNSGLEKLEAKASGVKNVSGRGFSSGDPYKVVLNQNTHPTVKPVSLMRYLVKMVMPQGGGICLDPFGGSGTTGCALEAEGMSGVLIEREEEYCEIARLRIASFKPETDLFNQTI